MPDTSETNSVDKTPGQVGYEAMLAKMLRDGNEEDRLYAEYNLWENQCAKLHADWEDVGAAIVKVFGASETNSASGCPNPSSVEKALDYAERKTAGGWVTTRDLDVTLRVLAAEVRRLRADAIDPLYKAALADRARLSDEVERLQKVVADHEDKARQLGESIAWLHQEKERLDSVVADQALTIGTLKDEIGSLTARVQWITKEESDRFAETGKLKKLLDDERSLSAAAAQHTTALERKVVELQAELDQSKVGA